MPFNPKEFSMGKNVPWQPASATEPADLDSIGRELKRRYRGGLAAVVFAPAARRPGWMPLPITAGQPVTVLVGLLLPAIQSARTLPRRLQLGEPWNSLTDRVRTSFMDVEHGSKLALRDVSWKY